MVRDVLVEDDGAVAVTIALTVAGCPLRHSFEDQVHASSAPSRRHVGAARLRRDDARGEGRARLAPARRPSEERDLALARDARGRDRIGQGRRREVDPDGEPRYALSALGEQVGVLDADVYGHSIPHMLGVHQRPMAVDEMIVPPVRGDLKLMSIGFFLEENAPIMWRGPMLHRALEQFLSDVHWGELDTLLVDMPPGTGDVAMSLGQLLPRAEASSSRRRSPPRSRSPCARRRWRRRGDAHRRRGREHVLSRRHRAGDLRLRRRPALADEIGVPLLARSRSTRCCARRRTRGTRCSRRRRTRRPRGDLALAEPWQRRGRDRSASR